MLNRWPLCLLLFASAACSQQDQHAFDKPAPSFGMLDLKLGEVYPKASDSRTASAVAGVVVYDLPMPVGPLSDTFYDYSAQVDGASKRLISVQAERTFSSYPECKRHLDMIVTAAKAKYTFELVKEEHGYSFDAESGPIKAHFMCSVKADLINPTLTMYLTSIALAEETRRRIIRQYDER